MTLEKNKTFYNKFNNEWIRILKSASQTNGNYSLIEVKLSPQGGNPLHYHQTFAENFEAVEGDLGVEIEKDIIILKPGENITVEKGVVHRFFNPSAKEDCVFKGKVIPGKTSFENYLKVIFGLTADGKTTREQIPYNPLYSAVLLEWGDTRVKNLFFFLGCPILKLLYTIAQKLGTEQKLLEKYCSE